jgi:hypothetical protein
MEKNEIDIFIGEYIRPIYLHNDPGSFLEDHDPIDRGLIFSRDIELIENYLNEYPWLLNVREKFFHNSALFLACEYDFPEVVELLLTRNAKISNKNLFHWTPLQVSRYHHSYKSLEILRDYSAYLIQKWWRKNSLVYKMKNKLKI